MITLAIYITFQFISCSKKGQPFYIITFSCGLSGSVSTVAPDATTRKAIEFVAITVGNVEYVLASTAAECKQRVNIYDVYGNLISTTPLS